MWRPCGLMACNQGHGIHLLKIYVADTVQITTFSLSNSSAGSAQTTRQDMNEHPCLPNRNRRRTAARLMERIDQKRHRQTDKYGGDGAWTPANRANSIDFRSASKSRQLAIHHCRHRATHGISAVSAAVVQDWGPNPSIPNCARRCSFACF